MTVTFLRSLWQMQLQCGSPAAPSPNASGSATYRWQGAVGICDTLLCPQCHRAAPLFIARVWLHIVGAREKAKAFSFLFNLNRPSSTSARSTTDACFLPAALGREQQGSRTPVRTADPQGSQMLAPEPLSPMFRITLHIQWNYRQELTKQMSPSFNSICLRCLFFSRIIILKGKFNFV